MVVSNRPADEPDPFADLEDETAATPDETREYFFGRAQRGYAVVRRTLLRQTTGPGPLAQLVRMHASTAIDLYLLRLALEPVTDVADLNLKTWARLLANPHPASEQAVSRALDALETANLISAPRAGRRRRTELLREDGSGEPYSPPTGSPGQNYFTVPFDFWRSSTPGAASPFVQLRTPGKVMLLVLLAETQGRPFAEVTAEWASHAYGLSTSTVERGYSQLTEAGLMTTRRQRKARAASPNGFLYIHHRALEYPFSTNHRSALRAEALAARNAKQLRGGPKKDAPAVATSNG